MFRGKVEVRVGGSGENGRVIALAEYESVRVDPAGRQVVTVARGTAGTDAFPLRMPRRMAMSVFNTGRGLKEGQPDLHWQLVARSDDPKLKPRPAVVTRVDPKQTWNGHSANDPARSQWLSTAGDMPDLPSGVTFTFRTTFELTGLLPKPAS